MVSVMPLYKWDRPKTLGDEWAPREGHTATRVDSLIYVFGGYSRHWHSDMSLLDTDTLHWSRVPPQPHQPPGRVGHTATLVVLSDTDYALAQQYEALYPDRMQRLPPPPPVSTLSSKTKRRHQQHGATRSSASSKSYRDPAVVAAAAAADSAAAAEEELAQRRAAADAAAAAAAIGSGIGVGGLPIPDREQMMNAATANANVIAAPPRPPAPTVAGGSAGATPSLASTTIVGSTPAAVARTTTTTTTGVGAGATGRLRGGGGGVAPPPALDFAGLLLEQRGSPRPTTRRYIVVFAGSNEEEGGVGFMADVWRLDLDTHAWLPVKTTGRYRPCTRSQHTAEAVGRWVFVFGGYGEARTQLNDFWALDTVTWTWYPVALPLHPENVIGAYGGVGLGTTGSGGLPPHGVINLLGASGTSPVLAHGSLGGPALALTAHGSAHDPLEVDVVLPRRRPSKRNGHAAVCITTDERGKAKYIVYGGDEGSGLLGGGNGQLLSDMFVFHIDVTHLSQWWSTSILGLPGTNANGQTQLQHGHGGGGGGGGTGGPGPAIGKLNLNSPVPVGGGNSSANASSTNLLTGSSANGLGSGGRGGMVPPGGGPMAGLHTPRSGAGTERSKESKDSKDAAFGSYISPNTTMTAFGSGHGSSSTGSTGGGGGGGSADNKHTVQQHQQPAAGSLEGHRHSRPGHVPGALSSSLHVVSHTAAALAAGVAISPSITPRASELQAYANPGMATAGGGPGPRLSLITSSHNSAGERSTVVVGGSGVPFPFAAPVMRRSMTTTSSHHSREHSKQSITHDEPKGTSTPQPHSAHPMTGGGGGGVSGGARHSIDSVESDAIAAIAAGGMHLPPATAPAGGSTGGSMPRTDLHQPGAGGLSIEVVPPPPGTKGSTHTTTVGGGNTPVLAAHTLVVVGGGDSEGAEHKGESEGQPQSQSLADSSGVIARPHPLQLPDSSNTTAVGGGAPSPLQQQSHNTPSSGTTTATMYPTPSPLASPMQPVLSPSIPIGLEPYRAPGGGGSPALSAAALMAMGADRRHSGSAGGGSGSGGVVAPPGGAKHSPSASPELLATALSGSSSAPPHTSSQTPELKGTAVAVIAHAHGHTAHGHPPPHPPMTGAAPPSPATGPHGSPGGTGGGGSGGGKKTPKTSAATTSHTASHRHQHSPNKRAAADSHGSSSSSSARESSVVLHGPAFGVGWQPLFPPVTQDPQHVPRPRCGHSATLFHYRARGGVNGTAQQQQHADRIDRGAYEMYVFGGRDGGLTYFNTLHRLNLERLQWTQIHTVNAPAGREGHTATLVGSRLFIIGGNTGLVHLNDVAVLNLLPAGTDYKSDALIDAVQHSNRSHNPNAAAGGANANANANAAGANTNNNGGGGGGTFSTTGPRLKYNVSVPVLQQRPPAQPPSCCTLM